MEKALSIFGQELPAGDRERTILKTSVRMRSDLA